MNRTVAVVSLDAWRCANLLVTNLGEGAHEHAERRRQELELLPDMAGVAIWRQIIEAVHALSRTEPASGEMLQ